MVSAPASDLARSSPLWDNVSMALRNSSIFVTYFDKPKLDKHSLQIHEMKALLFTL